MECGAFPPLLFLFSPRWRETTKEKNKREKTKESGGKAPHSIKETALDNN
jgi:hypothetical protein